MKYEHCVEHALDRAYERYFMCLDEEDLDIIIEMIQAGNARYAGIDWPTNSKWFVDYEGETMLVVYNGREKRICTFLPKKED